MARTERLEIRMYPEEKALLEGIANKYKTSKSDLLRVLIQEANSNKHFKLSIQERAGNNVSG